MSDSKPLSEKEIDSVLWSPVSSIVPSNESEKAVFQDKSDGWFYTFCLESGQKFVGHFTPPMTIASEYKRRALGTITFRPVGGLLSDIKEIRFVKPTIFVSEGKASISFNSNLDEDERNKYRLQKVLGFERFHLPLVEKAITIHLLLLTCADLNRELATCKNKLEEELTIGGKSTPKLVQKGNVTIRENGNERIKE